MISTARIRREGRDHLVQVSRIAVGCWTVKPSMDTSVARLPVKVLVKYTVSPERTSTVKSIGTPSAGSVEK